MSALVCAMSGLVPSEPIVSVKSGLLFEKKLIMKYVQDSGNCPVTGMPLAVEDLMPLKTNDGVKVRDNKTASLPGLLASFQDEWGSTVRECYELRKLLEQTRQELSHTLYQHDAACRVISRLVRERDDARQQLKDASAAGTLYRDAPPAAAQPQESMEVEGAAGPEDTGITDNIKDKMSKLASELSKSRKKREIPPTLASEAEVSGFSEKSTHPVHLANAILCVDLHPSKANLALTGGADNTVALFDRSSGQTVHKMKGHTKKVLRVLFHPTQDLLISSSADKTVKVWAPSTGKMQYTFKDHKADVTAITVHATGDYVVSASLDKTWALYDLHTGVCRKLVADAAATGGYTSAAFHPDGLILGTGCEDTFVRVWDVKTQQNVVTYQGHKGPVSALNFSENGYYLVTAGPDGFKTWDLRKVAKQGAQAAPVRHMELINGEANEAVFDYSGQYLACAGSKGVVVYHTKTWDKVLDLDNCHGNSVTGVRFGGDAKMLVSCSKDRTLKFFSA